MTWLVVELTPKAEDEDPSVIQKAIRRVVKTDEIFIPAVVAQKGTTRVVRYLVDGYAFIQCSCLERAAKYNKQLSNTRYVQSLLRTSSNFAHVTQKEIDKLKEKMVAEAEQGIGVGDTVLITSGPYKDLTSVVCEDIPQLDSVQVFVKLRSKDTLLTLPRSFLQLVSKNPARSWPTVSKGFYSWTFYARAVLEYTKSDGLLKLAAAYQNWQSSRIKHSACILSQDLVSPIELQSKYDQWEKLEDMRRRGRDLWDFIHALKFRQDPSALEKSLQRYKQLMQALALKKQEERLGSIVFPNANALDSLRSKHTFLRQAISKVASFEEEIGLITEKLNRGDNMVDNILIDGFNLFFRCLTVPGLSDLKDSQGRLTGAIHGFLRSLTAIRRREPKACIYVCWDGSSQRRSKMYAEYKANRSSKDPSAYFQLTFLKEYLPKIGVFQAINAEEEADDVIATLLSTELKDQRNMTYSNDRDLLQLASTTTVCWIPATGSGKEHFYDPDKVLADYGVMPEQMPTFRALAGDVSDNIPGVGHIDKKILSALVRSYGTVDAIYASGFPGLTKNQYKRLREAESQVRLNVELMSLIRDIPLTITPPAKDPATSESMLSEVSIRSENVAEFFNLTPGFHKRE